MNKDLYGQEVLKISCLSFFQKIIDHLVTFSEIFSIKGERVITATAKRTSAVAEDSISCKGT